MDVAEGIGGQDLFPRAEPKAHLRRLAALQEAHIKPLARQQEDMADAVLFRHGVGRFAHENMGALAVANQNGNMLFHGRIHAVGGEGRHFLSAANRHDPGVFHHADEVPADFAAIKDHFFHFLSLLFLNLPPPRRPKPSHWGQYPFLFGID